MSRCPTTSACANASTAQRAAACSSPAPAWTPRSGNCCSTPSPRSRSRSRSPCRPNCEARAEHADQLRRHNVERARHRADLARRRYLAVDPGNRLVADSLEADWNDALRAVQAAQDEYEKATAAAAVTLTDEHKARIHALASDFPALWSDPATPQRERKRMIRLLVEDVTLAKTDRIQAHVRFRGGQTTSLTLPIPPKSWQLRQTHPATLATLDRLLDEHTDAGTAEALNAAGHRSGEGKPFTGRIVLDLRRAHTCPATPSGCAPAACSTSPRSPKRSACTPPRSRPGTAPGCSPRTRPTTRTSSCSSRPHPATPASSPGKEARIRNRVPTQPAPGGAV